MLDTSSQQQGDRVESHESGDSSDSIDHVGHGQKQTLESGRVPRDIFEPKQGKAKTIQTASNLICIWSELDGVSHSKQS
jgi:hypothetical protein